MRALRTHARVIVQMDLDVAAHHSAERAYEVVHLAWVGAADSVSDTDAVDANLVDGLVDG